MKNQLESMSVVVDVGLSIPCSRVSSGLHFLEDHPSGCKWLITMVIVSPLTGVVGPLPNGLSLHGLFSWGFLGS